MKKLFLHVLLVVSILAISGCDDKNVDGNSLAAPTVTEIIEEPINQEDIDVPPELSLIEVSFIKDYIDNDRLHLKVYVKNNSDKMFSGDVYVFFLSSDRQDRLGSDLIIIEDLAPGQQSWSNATILKYDGTPQFYLEFTNPIFTEIAAITADIDPNATNEVIRKYKLNFEGVSWYDDVIDIVIYTDGTCVATIANETKEDSQFYASTIWGCIDNSVVNSIQIVNVDGNIKTVFP